MRQSIAAVAMIRRQQAGQTLLLAQWNPRWQKYHFVSGHKRSDETFRECMLRELGEELVLREGIDFRLPAEPVAHLEYTAWSESASAETAYTVELFEVEFVSSSAGQNVDADPQNRWLTHEEIRSERCEDGKPISSTMRLLLSKLSKWATVYVFISSTFNDMHGERDYLVKRVFPELQEWCERRKLRLVDIDLRWGVTEQDATLHKNVVKVCLSRIDDCRPFFLCFLGQRRGWVPRPDDVSPETLRSFPDLRDTVGTASVTEMEILHAILTPFHQTSARDTGKPAEYYQPAKYAYFYLRDRSYLDQLPTDLPLLRSTYTNDGIGFPDERETQNRTLEDWRNQKIPKTKQPVRFYHANWDQKATTPELRLPLACPSTLPAGEDDWRQKWKKEGVDLPSSAKAISPGSQDYDRAVDLNRRLTIGRLGGFTFLRGENDFAGEEPSAGASLGDVVSSDLKRAVTKRFPYHVETPAEDLQQDLDQHEEFLFNHCQGFIERPGVFSELDDYARRPDDHRLFALTAESGMGKSTLLARWVDRYLGGHQVLARATFHTRFIGASDNSATIEGVLRFLLRELQEHHGKYGGDIPDEPQQLRQTFQEALEAVGRHGPTVIVIDGLDQLETGLDDLSWLPHPLPPNVKLVVSFRRGSPAAESLYQRYASSPDVLLHQVEPFNNSHDRRRLVEAYLSQCLKNLDEPHLRALIREEDGQAAQADEPPQVNNPLYLRVVLSDLRVFGGFAGLADRIRQTYGDTPTSAFAAVLERLETDPAYVVLNTKVTVRLIFALLAHARRGLSADELADLIVMHYGEVAQEPGMGMAGERPFDREQAKDAVYVYLRQVRPFLARRQGRYDFFHESFKNAAGRRYSSETPLYHNWLANHFRRLADPAGDRTWGGSHPRGFSELPYHLHQYARAGGDPKPLYDLADDLRFRHAQLKALIRTEPLLELLRFAADRASAAHDPVACVRYALALLDLHGSLGRGYYNRLVLLAREQPALACELTNLLSRPARRLMALALVAWVWADQPSTAPRARDLLLDLGRRQDVWLESGHVGVALAIVRDMVERQHLAEAALLLDHIPACPLRRTYREAWASGSVALRALAGRLEGAAPEVPAEQWTNIAQIRLAVRELYGKLRLPHQFEERLGERFGLGAVETGWALLAEILLVSRDQDGARAALTRSLFLATHDAPRPVRTYLAMRDVLSPRERDLVKEYEARAENAIGWFEKLDGSGERGLAAALRAELHRRKSASPWLTATASQLAQAARWLEPTTPSLEDADSAWLLTAARSVAAGNPAEASRVLRKVAWGRPGAPSPPDRLAEVIAAFALSCCANDQVVQGQTAAILHEYDLHPELLQRAEPPEGTGRHAVFAALLAGGAGPVAAAAAAFRQAGREDLLFALLCQACTTAPTPLVIDAVLAQIVHSRQADLPTLKLVHQELVRADHETGVARGLGIYFFDGPWLLALWLGLILLGLGAAGGLLGVGVAVAAGIAASGLLDLLIWRVLGVWEKPERSGRYFGVPTVIGSIVVFGCIINLLSPSPPLLKQTAGGVIMAVNGAALLLVISGKGFFVIGYPPRVKVLGTTLAVLAGLAAAGISGLVSSWLSVDLLGGIHIAGAMLVGAGFNLLIKHVPVRRYYAARGVYLSYDSRNPYAEGPQ